MANKLASDTSEEILAGSSPVLCTSQVPRHAIRVLRFFFCSFLSRFKVGYEYPQKKTRIGVSFNFAFL